MMGVKISVIVPVYNIEEFLPNCIDSLVNQSFKDIEIILVNDGSSDNSPNICDEFAKMDERIKVIHKKNEGVSIARNTGIKVAKGEFIAFVDGDDWVERDIYSLMYKYITSSDIDLVMCRFSRVFPNGKIEVADEPLKKGEYSKSKIFPKLILPMIGNKASELTSNLIMGSTCRCLYKKKIIDQHKIQFPIIKIAEDMLFHLSYLGGCNKVLVLDKSLYNYRFNPLSATRNYINSLWETLIHQLDLVEKELKKIDLLNRESIERLEINTLYFISWSLTNECHPNNPKSFKQIIKYMKSISSEPKFREAFKWNNIKYAPIKQKLIFICLRFNLFELVYLYQRRKFGKI